MIARLLFSLVAFAVVLTTANATYVSTVSDLMRTAGGRLVIQNVRIRYNTENATWIVEERQSARWRVVFRTTDEAQAVTEAYRLLGLDNDEEEPTPTPVPTLIPSPTPTLQPPLSTSTPAPTATPSAHVSEDEVWHEPGAHGDRPAHEHGDKPPQWLVERLGAMPRFAHAANTPNENLPYWKHTAFKGWEGVFLDDLGRPANWYGIFHLDFNPAGHQSRFHSYQLWILDADGGLSHFHGWLDFGEGNNTGPNLVLQCQGDDSIRPIINPPSIGCPISFESWYARAGGSGSWAPDFGFNINPNYYAGGNPSNPATWTPTGGVRNLTRRVEWAWYRFRTDLVGTFWATQWGDLVSGPDDPVCNTQRFYGSRAYTTLCLEQYIAPTLRTIAFPNNSTQRTFNGDSTVVLPN